MHDAIVVGSGAAGGWAAKELCEGGLDVLMLEAGPAVRSGSGSAPPERRLASRLGALARGQHVQLRCPAFSARTRRFFVSDREHPYTTPRGAPFNWFRGRQVGGRLHVWARLALRLSDDELHSWPMPPHELAAYYDEVEAFLGVHDVPPTPAERRFAQAVAPGEVGAARVARQEPEELPATIRAAQDTGRLTIRPDAVVRRVTRGPGGRASGVELVDRRSGRAEEVAAGAVVLCASTIETLRILLNSGVDSAGRLGRRVTDHVMTGIGGPQADRGADAGEVTGFLMPRGRYGIQGGIGRGGPSWFMLGHGEMETRDENRVTLHPSRTDRFGIPLAHVACAHSGADSALAGEQLDAMRELADAAGLTVRTPPSGRALDTLAFRLARRRLLRPSGAFTPGSAAHEIGGAGMGEDPASSVTDPHGRLWEADNVVVADGAAFPAGCAANVTLTIMAHAVRASRRLRRDL